MIMIKNLEKSSKQGPKLQFNFNQGSRQLCFSFIFLSFIRSFVPSFHFHVKWAVRCLFDIIKFEEETCEKEGKTENDKRLITNKKLYQMSVFLQIGRTIAISIYLYLQGHGQSVHICGPFHSTSFGFHATAFWRRDGLFGHEDVVCAVCGILCRGTRRADRKCKLGADIERLLSSIRQRQCFGESEVKKKVQLHNNNSIGKPIEKA